MKNVNEKTEQLKEAMYQDSLIHFALNPSNKNVMVNATEMAKVFNKKTELFLKSKHAKKYIDFLNKKHNEYPPNGGRSDVKIVDDRGHMGIYFHRKLAIKFAMWLDDEFFDWVIETIDGILHGNIDTIQRAVSLKEKKLKARADLIIQASTENNKVALELLQLEKDIQRADYLERKAVKELKSQYKMDL